jgi:hypothetical protein
MKKINQLCKLLFWITGFLFLVPCCSPIPHLELTYRLPPGQKALSGKKVFVSVEDMRKDKNTIGAGARQDLQGSSGDISISIAKGEGPGIIKGIYQPPGLMKEALENRLRYEGADVVEEGEASTGISILIKSFLLDRKDWKWKVNIAYEARLVRDGKVLSRQSVSGEEERFELTGTEKASVVLGNIFTDVMNRLDLNKLFRESGP